MPFPSDTTPDTELFDLIDAEKVIIRLLRQPDEKDFQKEKIY